MLWAALHGYRMAAPAERASFWMLSAYSVTIGASRAINYGREQSRPAPRLRALARRAYRAAGVGGLRVHHFLPGIALAFTAGGAAILTRTDARELWLSVPFGIGAGLTVDEIGLLLKADTPYWRSETAVLTQGAVAGLAAAALAVGFQRRGAARQDDQDAGSGVAGP